MNRTIISAQLSRFILITFTMILSTSAVYSEPDDQNQKMQQLTSLFDKAKNQNGLWKGTAELYQEALTAFNEGNAEHFGALYPTLNFMLSQGLEQATSQSPDPLIPSYLQ